MEFPKVLVISQPFTNDTGGGITQSNLFSGWDRDKIAVICSGIDFKNNIDTSICNTYYQLGGKELYWTFPFNLINRKYTSGVFKFEERKAGNQPIKKSRTRVKVIMKYFLPLMEFTGLIYVAKKLELSDELRSWLDEFKPDVIYAQASSKHLLSFNVAVQSYLKKPMVFHMMDDWPSLSTNKGIFKNYWKRKIDSEFRIMLDKSSVLMSICDEMSSEYKRRYNKDFIPFHNPVDLDIWKPYQRNNYDLTDSPTILYAGRIGLGIDSSLELIAKSIDQVNDELNLSIKFILQTESKPNWSDAYNCVQHQSFVAYNDLPKVFSGADFLILPYDFSVKSIQFIKYSMPTKASEFMISGTPIIIFAPEETAIVKYARNYHWAKIITENNSEKLVESIKSLILNKDERQQYAQNAIRIADQNHKASKITKEFREVISSLAEDTEIKKEKAKREVV